MHVAASVSDSESQFQTTTTTSSFKTFQLWKDYFQLAKVVEGLNVGGGEEDGALLSPEKDHRPRQPLVLLSTAVAPADSLVRERGPKEPICCSFCRQNGESIRIYTSHRFKDETGRVQCPILRNYTCPQCGASKDAAHTRRFCPLTKKGYTSVYAKNHIRNSAGKRGIKKRKR